MALFAQYAMVAAQEALDDAEWKPSAEEDLEATVRLIPKSDEFLFADLYFFLRESTLVQVSAV
jgi:hypothetical protein